MKSDVLNILEELRPELTFSDETDFFEEGLLDSFDLMCLVSKLDEFYKVSIKGTDILPENFKNVDSIVLLLGKYGVSDES